MRVNITLSQHRQLMSHNLPVSIICGYLGSGKTSYINRKLKESKSVRYAILVNDFGELNIDAALIESESADVLNLVNGCVCCSIANDIYRVLDELQSISYRIDQVLLEASGVADGEKVKALVQNSPGYYLTDCLTLVDSTRIQSLLNDKFVGKHVSTQIEVADSIFFTKMDLLSTLEKERFRSWFNQRFYESSKLREASTEIAKLNESHPRYYSKTLSSEKPLDRKDLTKWLDQMQNEVLRLKGFVYLADDADKQYLLQYTESSWTLDVRGEWSSPPKSELTVISSKPIKTKSIPAGSE
ncbi:MAG: G3E family GTPase [Candidatus Azotimanducaceae bacterium]